MGSIADFQTVPTLTALERIGPKGYVRYILPFQLTQDYSIAKVTRVLRASYAATKRRLAVVGCEAVPDGNAKQGGMFKLRKLEDGAIEDITVQDLRAPGVFPMSYAELKAQHLPVASLDADTLCRRPTWPSPGERLPVSLVQANFIPGGLLLNWCTLHMVGDGTSYHIWMRIWAEECRRAQGLPIPIPDPRSPRAMLATNNLAQAFYFSPAALKALKADASPAHATVPTDQAWISTNDALSALLWRTIMAAQWPLDSLEGDPVSVFNVAIDGRMRTDPAVHPETLGCFLEYVGLMIRKQILRADRQFTDDPITLIDKVEDVKRLVPTALLDVPGYNCVLTSWINFQLYSLDWGALLGHRIEAVRSPHCGIINGLQLVLPAPPGGGLEILIRVESNCLDRLLHDPVWMKYATAR
ncbi:hypothetical protein BO71DRAFT_423304 [Aspergillus ellipticus CBS 707.79]|uniref:Trichothecene 3-O-acetyltransferase-like N-terminal domain-containing protein n=1 Tax=Aspergillus ellipticus CBS 707.79 TaxID=1448320 RepID=A0A319CUT3_9EURO|nr:hypothetical protein BO71DRAFT_423304 [Aspergillus ellipticus CBS 707.79]